MLIRIAQFVFSTIVANKQVALSTLGEKTRIFGI